MKASLMCGRNLENEALIVLRSHQAATATTTAEAPMKRTDSMAENIWTAPDDASAGIRIRLVNSRRLASPPAKSPLPVTFATRFRY
jgi:hypothetical protein